MKKKLLVLLLIIIVAAFAFVGCAPHPSEGEGEGEGEIEGILVEFAKEYRDGDKVYVAKGSNGVTVTFPAPVTGMVQIDLSNCTGDYSKGGVYLFPNADRTVWTGSVDFECSYWVQNVCDTCVSVTKHCCATTVTITSGACEADTCIAFPVIVDCDKPFAQLEVGVKDCCCSECAVTFKSVADPEENECVVCPPDLAPCCGDTCSDLASWSVEVRKVKVASDEKPAGDESVFRSIAARAFATNCCEFSTCTKLVQICEGEECPIECTLDCIEDDEYENYVYFAIITLKDNVGNTQKYYAGLVFYEAGSECKIDVYEGCCNDDGILSWENRDTYMTKSDKATIGACEGVSVTCEGN